MSWQRARRMIAVGTAVWLSTCAAAAYATLEGGHDPNLLGLPWMQAAVAIAITAAAGMAATWGRELTAIYAGRPFHLAREMRRDLAVSACVGIIGFAVGQQYHVPAAVLAILLVVGGYGGARVMPRLVDRMLGAIKTAPLPGDGGGGEQ